MSYINGRPILLEELIRIVNKLKKLIAKTLLYLNFVESDEFLRLTCYLIWTKDVQFAKTNCLERSSSYTDGHELMAWKTGRLPDYNYWHLNL